MSFIPTFVAGQALATVSQGLDNVLALVPQGKIGTIPIQATVREVHESELEITDHPVENGADITDHSYVRPIELTLECGWSNSNMVSLNGLVTGALNGVTGGGSSLFSDGSAPNADSASSVYSQLLALQSSRQPFSIVTTLRSYDNMLIKSIRVTRDNQSVNSLMATVRCRQVFLVTLSTGVLAPTANQMFPTSTADISNLGPVSLVPNVTPSPLGSLSATTWPLLSAPPASPLTLSP